MAKVRVEILGWEKFQPRRDVKSNSWFRFNHDMMFDPKWDEMEGEHFAVWLFLLSYASMKNRGSLEIEPSRIAKRARVAESAVTEALAILEENQAIQVVPVSGTDSDPERNEHVTCPSRERVADVSLRTDGRTDKTNEPDETDGRSARPHADALAEAAPKRRSAAPPPHPRFESLAIEEPGLVDLVGRIPPKVQHALVVAYPDAPDGWIEERLRKIHAWLAANPKRAPKGDYGRFVAKWLSDDWEQFRKSLPSAPALDKWDLLARKGVA